MMHNIRRKSKPRRSSDAINLNGSEGVSQKAAKPISYSDGETLEKQILDILSNTSDLASETSIGVEYYAKWPIRYHLCADRSLLLRPFEFGGLNVLELGSGMGGVSRFLAENCKHLTAVEGTEVRNTALRERLRDLNNWDSYVSNISYFETPKKFDVVCLIGVLEYAEIYIEGPSPFLNLLRKARSFLNNDGILIVAIENRLGLKYWAGASEDHTGKIFDSLVDYREGSSPRTFARRELLELLHQADLPYVAEYFPFPDYKLPQAILSGEFLEKDPMTCAQIASPLPYEDYAYSRCALMPDNLAALSVAKAGILSEFSNSFLFMARKNPVSKVHSQLCSKSEHGELGWHFNIVNRVIPTVTTFYRANGSEKDIQVAKSSIFPTLPGGLSHSSGELMVYWHPIDKTPLARGITVINQLAKYAYQDEWSQFCQLLKNFINWSFGKWNDFSSQGLKPESLDAIITNACFTSDDKYMLFDLEWTLDRPIRHSWFILRNIIPLRTLYISENSTCPFSSLQELYKQLCLQLSVPNSFDEDIEFEVAFQTAVGGRVALPTDSMALKIALGASMLKICIPRIPSEIVTQSLYLKVKAENDRFKYQQTKIWKFYFLFLLARNSRNLARFMIRKIRVANLR